MTTTPPVARCDTCGWTITHDADGAADIVRAAAYRHTDTRPGHLVLLGVPDDDTLHIDHIITLGGDPTDGVG